MSVQRVVPAILTDDPQQLERMVRLAEGFALWVQFDLMDGVFVPSRSVSVPDIAATKPAFPWEAHLMVRNPSNYIESLQLAGARRIIFHVESTANIIDKTIHIHSMGLQTGLALSPATPVSVVNARIAAELDYVLFLSVEPGYYGSPFIPAVLEKMKELRAAFPGLAVGIDGGIKAHNIAEVARAGADEICVGSAIMAQADPAAAWRELTRLAQEGWRSR